MWSKSIIVSEFLLPPNLCGGGSYFWCLRKVAGCFEMENRLNLVGITVDSLQTKWLAALNVSANWTALVGKIEKSSVQQLSYPALAFFLARLGNISEK